MPVFLIPGLLSAAAFFAGAFAGSQVDDAIDAPPQGASITDSISWYKVMLYGGGALGLYWLARKSGALKALTK